MAKRRCTSKTKAGRRCKSPPLDGEDFCISHAPKAVKAKAGFGGSENGAKGGHARRIPRLTELLTAKVEDRADEIIDKLLAGLDSKRALVVGTGPRARVEIVEDRVEILKTIREVFDRLEGRPKSTSEFTGVVEHRSDDQITREIERLTERLAEEKLSDNGTRVAA